MELKKEFQSNNYSESDFYTKALVFSIFFEENFKNPCCDMVYSDT